MGREVRSVSAISAPPARGGETRASKTTAILEFVDWQALPPRARAIARRLGPMLSDGFTLAEIGRHFGKSEDWASTRVQELRTAIVEQVRQRQAEYDRQIRELQSGRRRDG